MDNDSTQKMTQLVKTMKEIQEEKDAEIQYLKIALQGFVTASQKFIDKVESGRARSTETYNDLVACTKLAESLLNEQ